jgi:hypothetical protein
VKTYFVIKKNHDICFVDFYWKCNGLLFLNPCLQDSEGITHAVLNVVNFWMWNSNICIICKFYRLVRFLFLTVVLLKIQLNLLGCDTVIGCVVPTVLKDHSAFYLQD